MNVMIVIYGNTGILYSNKIANAMLAQKKMSITTVYIIMLRNGLRRNNFLRVTTAFIEFDLLI